MFSRPLYETDDTGLLRGSVGMDALVITSKEAVWMNPLADHVGLGRLKYPNLIREYIPHWSSLTYASWEHMELWTKYRSCL